MNSLCYELHRLVNDMTRYNFENIDQIPFKNGVYIFFEKGQKYGDFDRIVRVGTHKGKNRLKSRVQQHIKENKDRSIFRKNIGRAMLAQRNSDLLNYWNTKNKQKNAECLALEKEISEYMRENLSFVVFNIETKEERLRIEEGIISALYNSNDFVESDNWLGKYVPKTSQNHVQETRMWISQGFCADPLTDKEFERLKTAIKDTK